MLSRRQWLATLGSTIAGWRALPGLGEVGLVAASPGRRAGHVLVFHGARHGCCLLGGYQDRVPKEELIWVWNAGWKMDSASAGAAPFSRALGAAAYDAKHGVLHYYGGLTIATGRPTGEVWSLNSDGRWDISKEGSPGPRDHHVAVYDARRERMVVYGGQDAERHWATDVWEFDVKKWRGAPAPRGAATAPGPGGRAHHAMAYDSRRGRTVLFGGIGPDGQHRDETWEWDGAAWTQVTGPGPSARARHRMAYDAARGMTVLFGGDTGNPAAGQWTLSDETWTWDGASWQKLRPATSPEPRMMHAMAYDAPKGRIVLYGGTTAAATADDTWEWDGATWKKAGA